MFNLRMSILRKFKPFKDLPEGDFKDLWYKCKYDPYHDTNLLFMFALMFSSVCLFIKIQNWLFPDLNFVLEGIFVGGLGALVGLYLTIFVCFIWQVKCMKRKLKTINKE